MPRLKNPILEFKVNPVPCSTLYFNVKIFEFLKDLYAYAKKTGCLLSNNYTGLCRTNWDKKLAMGEILLAYAHCNPGVVAHECTHAATTFMGRKSVMLHNRSDGIFKGKYDDCPEEMLCYSVGNMTEKIFAYLAAYRKPR